ncbi:MAG: hypothetical protein ACKPKQ_03800, partial [Dolichospermum sp.]
KSLGQETGSKQSPPIPEANNVKGERDASKEISKAPPTQDDDFKPDDENEEEIICHYRRDLTNGNICKIRSDSITTICFKHILINKKTTIFQPQKRL